MFIDFEILISAETPFKRKKHYDMVQEAVLTGKYVALRGKEEIQGIKEHPTHRRHSKAKTACYGAGDGGFGLIIIRRDIEMYHN